MNAGMAIHGYIIRAIHREQTHVIIPGSKVWVQVAGHEICLHFDTKSVTPREHVAAMSFGIYAENCHVASAGDGDVFVYFRNN